MSKNIDITGKTFGALVPNVFLGGEYGEWQCTCLNCGDTNVIVRGKELRNGTRYACKKCRRNGFKIDDYTAPKVDNPKIKYDMTGMQVGSIVVLEPITGGSWKCKCKCGRIINVKGFNLRQALETNKDYMCEECSHASKLNDITGKTINNWHIDEYIGNGMYRCTCQCENKTVKIVNGKSIKNGSSKSCGCKLKELMQNTKYSKYGDITVNTLTDRSDEQILACSSSEELKKFILHNFTEYPTLKELADKLGISPCMASRKINNFKLRGMIQYNCNKSYLEKEVKAFIDEIYTGDIETNNRTILNGKEIDIYIPEKQLAIEFNGDYWHSNWFKDYKYHQNKTLECAKAGIQLISIFENEWIHNKNKIENLLRNYLTSDNKTIYGRDTVIGIVDNSIASEFLDKNHLQGKANADINIVLYYNNKIVGLLSFGKPRFNSSYDYELIRLCFDSNYNVVGGAEKMFKYFINKYSCTSIISYCNISKFNGHVYNRLGFKLMEFTAPGYTWINNKHEVLSRYQCQKHKLVKMFPELAEYTEDEIMESLGYFKVYDCGNAVYTFKTH